MLTRSVPAMLMVALAMFGVAPYLIAQAPYESTMGLVQKIFYFHAPVGIVMFVATFTCGFASVAYLVRGRASSDRVAEAAAELTVVLGAIVLITGPLWARKAWGVWWQWDARLTSTLVLWLLFVGLPAAAALRRAGHREAGGRRGAVRHGQRAVHLLVGERLADDAPEDDGRAVARSRRCGSRSTGAWWRSCCCSSRCCRRACGSPSSRMRSICCWPRRKARHVHRRLALLVRSRSLLCSSAVGAPLVRRPVRAGGAGPTRRRRRRTSTCRSISCRRARSCRRRRS